jgi:hypothetical protein
MLSTTMTELVMAIPDRWAAARKGSGSGLAKGTSSRVTTGTDGGTPSLARFGAAVARVPLVAIA